VILDVFEVLEPHYRFGWPFESPVGVSLRFLTKIWIWFEFLRASNLWGKNLNNSPKFSLGMIFMNMNLDGITCMQNFEDPIEVAFGLDLITKKNLNIKFELMFAL
jgi:hypothetical protein